MRPAILATALRRAAPPAFLAALLAAGGCSGGDSRTCAANGSACAAAADCCSGNCAGGRCEAPVPACALPLPQPSALPAGRVLELGVHAVGETVAFDVPAGTGSVTMLQQGAEPLAATSVTLAGNVFANSVVPLSVSAAGVGEIFNFTSWYSPPSDPAASGVRVYYNTEAGWAGAMTIPNTSRMLQSGVPSSRWSLSITDLARECPRAPQCVVGSGVSYPPGRYDVKVLLKPGPVPPTGTVDVVFQLLTDDPVLTGSSPLSNASVLRMVSTLGQILGQVGIALGNVSFRDLPQAVKDGFPGGVDVDDASPCGDVATLLQQSGPGNAMSLFLVDYLVSSQVGGGTTVVGIDGSVPGPSSVGGTVASGAAVSIANLYWQRPATPGCGPTPSFYNCGADRVAYIAAHEMGHFLGLYHETESDGTLFDPLSDTPTCPCSRCRPAGATQQCYPAVPLDSAYQMTGADCTASPTCGGGGDLMFWLVSSASQGTLTAQQGQILRANPLVR
jgi:hypothetical protein